MGAAQERPAHHLVAFGYHFLKGKVQVRKRGPQLDDKLFEARQRLNDLLAKLDGNDTLDLMLQSVVGNADEMKQLKAANDGGTQNA